MRTLLFTLVAAGLAACAGSQKRPTPVLAPVESDQLSVQFLGSAADRSELYVCGFLGPKVMSCVEFATFMENLYETEPQDPPAEEP
jgi:hypothetical protein